MTFIALDFLDIWHLSPLYSEDDYWIRYVKDGVAIQAAIDKANGRFIIGYIMERINRDIYDFITGSAAYFAVFCRC